MSETKIQNVNAGKRTVILQPPLFGPFQVTAKSDADAVRRVIKEHVQPAIDNGAIREDVIVVCGDVTKVVGP